MLNPVTHTFKYGKHTITIETGIIARQATSSVVVNMDDTTVFVTVVVANQIKSDQNFLPLTVNYQERTYAAGRFPGGFFRREGRPSENEILISRLIDRPIRPLFPKNFLYEVQIIATVVSVNPQINPDIVAIIGTSAALRISGIPFNKTIGVARVGFINNKYILNPTVNELSNSILDMIVSGTEDAVLMVESESHFLSEDQMLSAILYGYNKQKSLIKNIDFFTDKVNKPECKYELPIVKSELYNQVIELSELRIKDAYLIYEKKIRHSILNDIKDNVVETILSKCNNVSKFEILNIINLIEKNIVRNRILSSELRIDGRKKNEIRSLDIRTGILTRTHGSALFTRGETQALVTVTLGTDSDAQNIDELIGERINRFLLHYNFPPYCVGEIGSVGSPKRREIGHGHLARRGLIAVMPDSKDFPYTIRIVSEITESNGSSSMASVCGASLALMDAGVPIKSSVAGIAMGLIKEKNNFVILSDILGDEDYLGDMDFKIARSREGITALQMDMKIEDITQDIIRDALIQAKIDCSYIIDNMERSISSPRKSISEFAPRIYTIKISPDKIKDVIGKGGSIIRNLTEETSTTIEISDDGTIKIASVDSGKADIAISRIKEITSEIKIGNIYNGRITRITSFGAFVLIPGGKEGLVHISQISHRRIEKISDYLKLGQEILVKVLEIDRYGRIRLSIKEVKP